FAEAINLEPFTRDEIDPKGRNEKRKVTNVPTCLCPASKPPTRADAVELMNAFFNFVTEREQKFEFWFGLWKVHYWSVFYYQLGSALLLRPSSSPGMFFHQIISTFSIVYLVQIHDLQSILRTKCKFALWRELKS